MIAQRIITLRKRAGLTQVQLADRLCLSPSALGNYEQGRRLPNVELLIEMAELFDVSLDYLITGKVHSDSGELTNALFCPCATCYWANHRHSGGPKT